MSEIQEGSKVARVEVGTWGWSGRTFSRFDACPDCGESKPAWARRCSPCIRISNDALSSEDATRPTGDET